MASPDTIILLIVDYHAAIVGARLPCPVAMFTRLATYGGATERTEIKCVECKVGNNLERWCVLHLLPFGPK